MLERNNGGTAWPRWLIRLIVFMVPLNLAVLAVELVLRIRFPWDLFIWGESPFMTDLLKLDSGQPIFGPPADGNSFFYSPGLTYLAYALLKPLGLHLDIRYCRIVTISVAITAGIVAGFACKAALNMIRPEANQPRWKWLGCGLCILVIFKNFNADITHPDNMVMLHTACLYLLTVTAVSRQSFSFAVAAVIWSGVGVFAKQTLCVSFLGPTLLFFCLNYWGRPRSFLLAFAGATSSALALAALWHPTYARFYTWEVLTQQKLHLTRFYWLVPEFLYSDRAVLAVLGIASAGILWRAGAGGRRYLLVCACIGIFSVSPGALAFAKHFGTTNNLGIFALWLIMLTWPAISLWLNGITKQDANEFRREPHFNFFIGALLLGFVFILFPIRLPATRSMVECCQKIQTRVTADIKDGRRVLVAHGTMYQLRAGSREIPLDRVNSIVDLVAAGLDNRTAMADRIRAHYYDRLYLVVEDWYGEPILSAINKHYVPQEIIHLPKVGDRIELGRCLPLIGDCKIMVPRSDVSAEPATNATTPATRQ